MNASDYKAFHEAFMKNNHGTTPLHAFMSIFFTVQCTACLCVTNSKFIPGHQILEYLVIVLPLIAAHTIFSKYVYSLNVLIFIILINKLMYYYKYLRIKDMLRRQNVPALGRFSLVTILRGLTYLITAFCILAVDFQVFPRHLAKTERYGFSLMDTGVGLFILMSGLVHKDSRFSIWKTIVKSNAKFVICLLLLGISRLTVIKLLKYQEHVTEYGVHWNFFFTLAVCKILGITLLYQIDEPLFLSMITLLAHECMLALGLQAWVFSDLPRNCFFNSNREGITSSFGYLALFFYGAYIRDTLNERYCSKSYVVKVFLGNSIILWTITYLLNNFLPASRVLANSVYCTYLAAIFVTTSLFLYILEAIFSDFEKSLHFNVPLILNAVNKNGLTYFLIANLLTGVVNMCLQTLLLSNLSAFVILNIYMMCTIGIVVYIQYTITAQ